MSSLRVMDRSQLLLIFMHRYGGSKVYTCQVNFMANFGWVYSGQWLLLGVN